MSTAAGRRHIIVTGGAGFIGSHLVERLLADGSRVVVIDDFSTGRKANLRALNHHPRLELIEDSVSGFRGLTRLVERAESIYHLAAAVGVQRVLDSPLRAIRTNLKETEAILESAASFGVPVLLTSTSEVYGKSRKRAFSESDDLVIGSPMQARWSYACSKLLDEFLVLAYGRERGLPVIIARLFNTVGPRQTGRYGMVLPRFIAAAQAGKPLEVYGDGRQTRCFCHVRDAVEALIRLQRAPAARGRIFNIGTREEISIGQLARLVIRVLGSRSRVVRVPYQTAYGEGFADLRQRRPDVRNLKRTIGFIPETPLTETIQCIADLRRGRDGAQEMTKKKKEGKKTRASCINKKGAGVTRLPLVIRSYTPSPRRSEG